MNLRRAATIGTFLCAVLIIAAITGCSAASGPKMGAATGAAPNPTASTASNSTLKASGGAMAASEMPCGQCANKGKVPTVSGAVKVVDGVQVVEVGMKDELYTPNTFAAKAGMPIKVVFTGKALACQSKPTFSTLKKSVDIKTTGTGTIDLGTLAAGTYEFDCAMGSYGGKIVVE